MLVIENCNSLSDLRQKLIDGEEVKTARQEPCENAIDRDKALETIRKLPHAGWLVSVESVLNVLSELSPVTSQPKTGYWILTSDDNYEYCTCSECGYQNGENWMIGSQIKYCQECGAKMVEPQERSGEE